MKINKGDRLTIDVEPLNTTCIRFWKGGINKRLVKEFNIFGYTIEIWEPVPPNYFKDSEKWYCQNVKIVKGKVTKEK
jgi:hypothetical protein